MLVGTQLAQVNGRYVDGAAEFGSAGQFRVVVGVAGLPDELTPFGEPFEESEHFRSGLDVLPYPRLADQSIGDLPQVFDHAFGCRSVTLPALRGRAGHPDAAPGQSGRATEERGLFHHQRIQPRSLGGQGGRHPAAARSDDQYVDNEVEAVHCGRHFGTAVLMAKPAISSAAGL